MEQFYQSNGIHPLLMIARIAIPSHVETSPMTQGEHLAEYR